LRSPGESLLLCRGPFVANIVQCRPLARWAFPMRLFFSSSGLEYNRQRLDGSQAALVVVEYAPTRCTVRAENRPSIGMFAFFYFCHQINFVVWSQVGGISFYQISDLNRGHIVAPCASRDEQLCRCPCHFHGWTCSCAFLLPGGSRQRVQSGFVPHVSSYLYYA